MKHTVEIADSKGKTMQLSVTVETLGLGGSWRAIDKGMLRHNSGAVQQWKDADGFTLNVSLLGPDKHWGIHLDEFISWGTVNDEGTGTVVQPWVVGLEPGAIEWSIA